MKSPSRPSVSSALTGRTLPRLWAGTRSSYVAEYWLMGVVGAAVLLAFAQHFHALQTVAERGPQLARLMRTLLGLA
jgi:hypothetical protein